MKVIETTGQLNDFCTSLAKQEFITVDLEFHREKTYYAKLGLIQVACPGDEAVIDPLTPNICLDVFFSLLQNPAVTKVFHSCRQDIEILYLLTGAIPAPLFDTQVAAQVCGLGASISYENLVKHILKIDLDKSSRLTNWCSRPLNPKQLEYAIADVTHLVHIYKSLREQLAASGREHWIDEEMQALLSPETYAVNPDEVWHKIRHHSHNAKYLTLLRDLARWRELRAQSKDIPRQTVIKDDCLLNIAASRPHSVEELGQIRNIRKDIISGRLAKELVDIVNAAEQYTAAEYVRLPKEKKAVAGSAELYELLKLLLNIKSRQEGVVARLIASDEELKSFAAGEDENHPVLQGWRLEIFGRDALRLRNGTLSIRFNKEQKTIDFIEC